MRLHNTSKNCPHGANPLRQQIHVITGKKSRHQAGIKLHKEVATTEETPAS